jgi:DNA polymerase-3 subunit delta
MVYSLTGKNTFLLKKQLDKIIAEFVSVYGDLALENIDASEAAADTIIQASQSLPFLAERKLVLVKQAALNAELLDRIEELVERNQESVDVYLVGPVFDARKSSYKKLQKVTKLSDFKVLQAKDLVSWVVGYVQESSGKISRKDAALLVERVGENQQLLAQEIEKLILYASEITTRSIELLSDATVQSSIFTLLDAAFKKDTKKTISLYKLQRQAQIDPGYIIAMLTWQLQSIALAVYASPQTVETLVAAGQSPFASQKALQLAHSISKENLRQLVEELSHIDAQIKNSAVDADAALELFFLRITS